ncbi:MAG: glycosyltransferase [Flavobacteriaceae bacterium]|nr:glycosyltransferase [Flavobacteriaceae bacterium]
MNYELTIIIPVYNEAANLLRVETEMLNYFKVALVPSKVLFVDDGSKDDSLNLIKEICSRHDGIFEYISFEKNQGLSAALKAGFDFVNTELTGYIDSDLQTTPLDFNVLLPHIKNYDLVTGVRTERKDSFIKNLSSKIANLIRRAFTQDGMDDTGCPLKIMKSSVVKKIPMFKGLHRFLPAMVLLQGGTIVQIPVKHFPRIAGKAKFGLRNRIFGPLMDCFAYLWMKRNYINYNVAKKSE